MNKLHSFCFSLLKRYKKDIKSIWFAKNSISLLVSENKKKVEERTKNLAKKVNLNIKINVEDIENYFGRILKGDNQFYDDIMKYDILYDPNRFIDSIQGMIKTGEILGTKESLIRKFVTIKEHFKEIDKIKNKVLDNIYMCVIEMGESLLIEKFNVFCIPKEVPFYLEKYLVRKGKLEKKYLNYCKEIVTLFKEIEHGKRTLPYGRELDIMQKDAGLFKDRMEELLKVA